MADLTGTRPLTLEDLYDLPDDGLRHELLRGTLVSEPPPGGTHGRIVARIAMLLGNHVRRSGSGTVYAGDTSFVLARDPDTVRAPDVAYLSPDRRAAIEDESRPLPGAPDLAVEVLSPSDRPGEVHGKVADWLAAGARLVWVADPARREISVFRTPLAPRRLSADDRLEGEDLLPGFGVTVAAIFED